MQAFLFELLSPFFFINKRKNKNGKWNKFYHTNGKFFCYKYRGNYFFKSKGKVYGVRTIPKNIDDGMERSFFSADKAGFQDGQADHWHSSYTIQNILEMMGADVEIKRHGIDIPGQIKYKDGESIEKKKPAIMKNLFCPTYIVNGNNHDKIVLSGGMKFNWDSSVSEETLKNSENHRELQKMLDAYLDGMRLRTNRMAKGRRLDNKVVRTINAAEISGDWSAISPSDTFNIKNVSTRRKMLTKFSVEEIVNAMDPETVDTAELNNSKYELIKFPQTIDANEPFTHCYYLRMLNVSTGETHLEGVAPYIENNTRTWGAFSTDKCLYAETVKAALAWRDRDVEDAKKNNPHNPMKNEYERVVEEYNQPVALS
jgi:hypothetical protein